MKHTKDFPSLTQAQKMMLGDLTGRLPILLDTLLRLALETTGVSPVNDGSFNAIVSKLWTSPEASAIMVGIHDFAHLKTEKIMMTDPSKLVTYVIPRIQIDSDNNIKGRFRETLAACVVGEPVSPHHEYLIDWRYFYVSDGEGNATSVIARRAGAEYLRSVMSPNHFLGAQWFYSLRMAGGNPSILGFFVEQMVLSWISLEGCMYAGEMFGGRPKTVLFTSPHPPADIKRPGFTCYIPSAFNFRAVDAILVFVGNEKAVVVGVQITIAKTHSDSEEAFFQEWNSWMHKLVVPSKNIEFKFLWIVEDRGEIQGEENIPPKTLALRGREGIIHPAFVRLVVTVGEINQEIGRKLQIARDLAERLEVHDYRATMEEA